MLNLATKQLSMNLRVVSLEKNSSKLQSALTVALYKGFQSINDSKAPLAEHSVSLMGRSIYTMETSDKGLGSAQILYFLQQSERLFPDWQGLSMNTAKACKSHTENRDSILYSASQDCADLNSTTISDSIWIEGNLITNKPLDIRPNYNNTLRVIVIGSLSLENGIRVSGKGPIDIEIIALGDISSKALMINSDTQARILLYSHRGSIRLPGEVDNFLCSSDNATRLEADAMHVYVAEKLKAPGETRCSHNRNPDIWSENRIIGLSANG
jgi:hypothetical protein